MAYEYGKRQARYLHLKSSALLDQPWEADFVFKGKGGSIGRANENDFVLPEERVSRNHAMITYENGDYFLTDQDSVNGTFVNDAPDRLEPGQAYRIQDDDRLRIGDCLVVASLVPADGAEDYEALPEMEDYPGSVNRPGWFPSGDEDEPEVPAEISSQGVVEERPPVSAMKEHMPQPVSDVPPPEKPARRASSTTVPTGFIPRFDDSPDEELLPGSSSLPIGGPGTEPEPEPAPVTDQSAVIPTVPHPDLSQADKDLLVALLRGLGSPALQVPPEKAMEFATQVGQLAREAVQGLIETLRQRNAFKSTFSIPVTRIVARDNNVFKYSANVDDALPRFFSRTDSAYLGPRESTRQAFQDIAADYVALMAGMQAAVGALLDRFSPQVLEERVGKATAINGVVPQLRQALLWEQFEKEYSLIKEQAEEDFERVFGQHFEQAYTDKIRQLHSAGFGGRQDPES
jgi:type VI secretion system FHA domain protein